MNYYKNIVFDGRKWLLGWIVNQLNKTDKVDFVFFKKKNLVFELGVI